MSRTLTAGVLTAIAAGTVRPVIFADLEFDSGTEYLHSAFGDLVNNSNTYTGVGDLGKITTLQEPSDLSAQGFTLELSGIDPTRLAQSISEDTQGRTVKIWIGFLDEDYALIADPIGPHEARMDVFEIELGDTATVALRCESPFADWSRPNIRRYTDEDQQAVYPGDRFFEFGAEMAEKDLIWPAGPAAGKSEVNEKSTKVGTTVTKKVLDRDGGGTQDFIETKVLDRDGGGTTLVPVSRTEKNPDIGGAGDR